MSTALRQPDHPLSAAFTNTTSTEPSVDQPGVEASGVGNDAGDAPAGEPAWSGAQARRGPLLDPGWFFLLAGIALIGATVLLPARLDLEEARFYRDRVQAVKEHRQERMARYQAFLGAVQQGDEQVVRSLAAMQLNKAGVDETLILPAGEISQRSASVFAGLEPPSLRLPEREVQLGLLEKWSLDESSRLWLIAGGALCILIGLLPMARSR